MADAHARIEQLAERLWPGRGARLDTRAGLDLVDRAGGVLIGITEHEHALEAMEMAVLVMLARTQLDAAYRRSAELEVMVRRADKQEEGEGA